MRVEQDQWHEEDQRADAESHEQRHHLSTQAAVEQEASRRFAIYSQKEANHD